MKLLCIYSLRMYHCVVAIQIKSKAAIKLEIIVHKTGLSMDDVVLQDYLLEQDVVHDDHGRHVGVG